MKPSLNLRWLVPIAFGLVLAVAAGVTAQDAPMSAEVHFRQ